MLATTPLEVNTPRNAAAFTVCVDATEPLKLTVPAKAVVFAAWTLAITPGVALETPVIEAVFCACVDAIAADDAVVAVNPLKFLF